MRMKMVCVYDADASNGETTPGNTLRMGAGMRGGGLCQVEGGGG